MSEDVQCPNSAPAVGNDGNSSHRAVVSREGEEFTVSKAEPDHGLSAVQSSNVFIQQV